MAPSNGGGSVSNEDMEEADDAVRLVGQARRETRQVRVEPDTQQRIVAGPGRGEFSHEIHVAPLVTLSLQTPYCTRRPRAAALPGAAAGTTVRPAMLS